MSVDMSGRKETVFLPLQVLPLVIGDGEAGMEFIFYRVTFLCEYWEKGDYPLKWNQNKNNVNEKWKSVYRTKHKLTSIRPLVFAVEVIHQSFIEMNPGDAEVHSWTVVMSMGFKLHSLGQTLVLPLSAELPLASYLNFLDLVFFKQRQK